MKKLAFKLRDVDSPMKCWKGYRRKPGTRKVLKVVVTNLVKRKNNEKYIINIDVIVVRLLYN